jgi:hypothetical protein
VHLSIPSIPINNGAFSSTTTVTGLVGSDPATFTYTFNGYIHGPNGAGKARINGIWRDNVTYADSGTSFSCTTSDHSYAATLDSQGSGQNTPTATPGSYTALDNGLGYSVGSFAVSPDGGSIASVAIDPGIRPSCTPNATIDYVHLSIASIPINNGSFSFITTKTGLVGSDHATFTYTFNGYIHGLNGNGKARINGTWREDVTYADSGVAHYCTTNNHSYAATHQ